MLASPAVAELAIGWGPPPAERTVATDLPQEALMVREFARLVKDVRDAYMLLCSSVYASPLLCCCLVHLPLFLIYYIRDFGVFTSIPISNGDFTLIFLTV